MRAPFQVLVIPYKWIGSSPLFCLFRRSDGKQWQFIAGGGEDDETPLEAAMREAAEESSVRSNTWKALKSLSYVPSSVIQEQFRKGWPANTCVIPEYAFAFECSEDVCLSREHTEYQWLSYEEAVIRLEWDSNRTALYELNCRLKNKKAG